MNDEIAYRTLSNLTHLEQFIIRIIILKSRNSND